MPPKLVGLLAISATLLAPLPGALAASHTRAAPLTKGDLVITFSGYGGGGYRFHTPTQGTGTACRVADTTYSETDAYHWSFRFVLPPTGGSTDAPLSAAAAGQLSSSLQLLQCAGTAAATSTCTQALRAPFPAESTDLTYPGITVGLVGRSVSIGAVGELLPATPQPLCDGIGVLLPNPVEAFAQLQTSVAIPRAQLAATGDVIKRFTIADAGLYAGVALSGSCNSATCDTQTCADATTDVSPPAGTPAAAPSSCSFDETYSGTIEVRVVK
ncbi:MAG: hypothetical protein ABSH27_12775 [Solirubrobacteraceae bacterium]|jgi:hypothetical protein